MQQPGFDPRELEQFDAAREIARLDHYVEEHEHSPFSSRDGWLRGSVQVRVPKEGVCYASEEEAPFFTIDDVWHRPFSELIRSALKQPCVKRWHMIPHRLYCASAPHRASPSNPEPPNPSSEIYNSDAALEEYESIRARPREAGDPNDLEYGMPMIILYSNSTHLTNFSHASMWPIYVYFGNQSKYERARPSLYPAHHLAYIPSLPDRIQDFYTRLHGIAATVAVLTFLRRELMQQILLLLLNDRLMYIYVHGDVVECGDGVRRREFPWFFIYSADYVEK
ncbi:hypothetical protein C8Q76DRAFT_620727 [Earliella scabrosa]|nr:hypothetical protein C8Q76DRAFT_620727 [Earliella scabrosa]